MLELKQLQKDHHREILFYEDLKKYREFLLILYLSIKQRNYDSAISLLPQIDYLCEQILNFIQKNNQTKQKKTITNLTKRVLKIQKKIEREFDKFKSIYYFTLFRNEVEILIKKFLNS